MELSYIKHGDYYIPDLTVFVESYEIGSFGRLHLKYLKQHKKTVYSHLTLTGRVNDYLHDIDVHASEMLSRLISQMSATQGIAEELKASDQMRWVGMMNNIRHSAEEIVLKDLIYT